MNTLAHRLNAHFAALTAAALAITLAPAAAEASIVYSGVQNVSVPATSTGLYLNLVTGVGGDGSTPGWDLNPWLLTPNWHLWADVHQSSCGMLTGAAGAIEALTAGQLIDPTGTYIANPANPAGGLVSGLYGIRFINEAQGSANDYGWARLIFPASGPATVVDWAYDDSGAGIAAGAVPAPGAIGLLVLGAASAARRRRT